MSELHGAVNDVKRKSTNAVCVSEAVKWTSTHVRVTESIRCPPWNLGAEDCSMQCDVCSVSGHRVLHLVLCESGFNYIRQM